MASTDRERYGSLYFKSHETQRNEFLERRIRKNLSKIIVDPQLTRGDKETLTFAESFFADYARFRFNPNEQIYAGTGEAGSDTKVGKVLDPRSMKWLEDENETTSFPRSQVEAMVFENMAIPSNAKKNKSQKSERLPLSIYETSKRFLSTRDKKDMVLRQIRRENTIGEKGPLTSKRRTYQETSESSQSERKEQKPYGHAVPFFIVDRQGPLTPEQQQIVEGNVYWIQKFLGEQYQTVEPHFIQHSIQASQVSSLPELLYYWPFAGHSGMYHGYDQAINNLQGREKESLDVYTYQFTPGYLHYGPGSADVDLLPSKIRSLDDLSTRMSIIELPDAGVYPRAPTSLSTFQNIVMGNVSEQDHLNYTRPSSHLDVLSLLQAQFPVRNTK